MMIQILILFSAVSFLIYGPSCLFSQHMKEEFVRFGLSDNQRLLTGCLQLAGAGALFLSLAGYPVGVVASAGLSLMMLLGVAVRIRIRDSLLKILPAAFYCALNAWIAVSLFNPPGQ